MKTLYTIKWVGIVDNEEIKGTSDVVASSWNNAEKKIEEVLKLSNIVKKKLYCKRITPIFVAE